jgi:hypothetical protein
MLTRSAWSFSTLAGFTFLAMACSAYPDRTFPALSSTGSSGAGGTAGPTDDASSGTAGDTGTSGMSGTGGSTSTGDAAAESGAIKDASATDAKGDVDRQVCRSPGAHPGLDCRCADGTVDDEFNKNLVGCADSPDFGTTWAMRGTACGPSCTVASTIQWVSAPGHGTGKPRFNYWLDDDLQLSVGTMSGACAVHTLANPAGEPCAGQPMHVCVPSTNAGQVTDPVGGTCDLHDCGFETVSPNNYLGGCMRNRTAGTLCYCP